MLVDLRAVQTEVNDILEILLLLRGFGAFRTFGAELRTLSQLSILFTQSVDLIVQVVQQVVVHRLDHLELLATQVEVQTKHSLYSAIVTGPWMRIPVPVLTQQCVLSFQKQVYTLRKAEHKLSTTVERCRFSSRETGVRLIIRIARTQRVTKTHERNETEHLRLFVRSKEVGYIPHQVYVRIDPPELLSVVALVVRYVAVVSHLTTVYLQAESQVRIVPLSNGNRT